jgi:hypothetical protein
MYKAKIKLVYKQVIDESSISNFEKAIFNASYQEFLLKSQAYNLNGRLKSFSRIKSNDGRANSLHYKLSFAVVHFISQLNNKIPIIKDNLGNKLSFETARFELIESHSEDISLHKIAINYETAILTLIEFVGEFLLLSCNNSDDNKTTETFVVRMQPNLSIISYEEIVRPPLALTMDNNIIPL